MVKVKVLTPFVCGRFSADQAGEEIEITEAVAEKLKTLGAVEVMEVAEKPAEEAAEEEVTEEKTPSAAPRRGARKTTAK